ncbi:DUF302 domain-containing protein [Dactylosporangium sp. NPDC051484]|uniref:DUF302 domain-containing protein n=1 Tax=Dactylosporangium sp. NPDC051484 TaxID=3154942 RepID=UPI00344D1775
MSTLNTVIDHPDRRLVVALPHTYERAREHYEALVPEADLAALHRSGSWAQKLELAGSNAPHGFMRYYTADIAAVMAGSARSWSAMQYLMGNHTIAERMYRHDPSVMLHAPLRTLLYTDPGGGTRLAVDQPSLLFASYGDARIAEVGEELDALLARLLALLDADPPKELTPRPGEGRPIR